MFGSVHRNSDPENPNNLNGPSISQESPSQPTVTTGMSWELRVQSFVGLFILSIIASFCGSYLLLLTKITGFCIMTSISAILSLSSTCCLMGPIGQIKKMFDKSRWIASSMYILFIFLTLLSGLVLKNSLLAIICTAGQYIAMAWYSLSYIPYAREAVSKIFF
ncbi:Vesicle transport protein [Caenorhabditis elegans]|uniref:Vesicle transport protein n=1 Tax=Caenorhabditis elegans TaxID=6239 RepID=Q7YTP0_CAEEL|nr:Vesicle transport protein [Caenorhabditis elegans]CAE17789.1 Vesicle transport protein [Caenorhabditis elegans]|eukprot:NP_001021422.1 Vesicle transport protein [Caenorhabditis elegans]